MENQLLWYIWELPYLRTRWVWKKEKVDNLRGFYQPEINKYIRGTDQVLITLSENWNWSVLTKKWEPPNTGIYLYNCGYQKSNTWLFYETAVLKFFETVKQQPRKSVQKVYKSDTKNEPPAPSSKTQVEMWQNKIK